MFHDFSHLTREARGCIEWGIVDLQPFVPVGSVGQGVLNFSRTSTAARAGGQFLITCAQRSLSVHFVSIWCWGAHIKNLWRSVLERTIVKWCRSDSALAADCVLSHVLILYQYEEECRRLHVDNAVSRSFVL